MGRYAQVNKCASHPPPSFSNSLEPSYGSHPHTYSNAVPRRFQKHKGSCSASAPLQLACLPRRYDTNVPAVATDRCSATASPAHRRGNKPLSRILRPSRPVPPFVPDDQRIHLIRSGTTRSGKTNPTYDKEMLMTSRQRLLTVLSGGIPDCVHARTYGRYWSPAASSVRRAGFCRRGWGVARELMG